MVRPPNLVVRRAASFGVALFLAVQGGIGLHAQSSDGSDVVRRLDGLEQGLRDIKQQLEQLTGARPSPLSAMAPFDLSVANAPTRGAARANVAIIEFADFQCPFCARHAQTVLPEIIKRYVETGKLRYVFRNMPLQDIHPAALKAALAARCATDQGRFWEMHDRIFANQGSLFDAVFADHAQASGLDMNRFNACREDSRTSAIVEAEFAEARRLGLTGTPAFLVGRVVSESVIRVSQRIDGAVPFDVFAATLDALISAQATP